MRHEEHAAAELEQRSSSHSIASTSRWFVGSSSSSRSGSPTSARASATRRRQPPESAADARVRRRARGARARASTRSCRRQPSRRLDLRAGAAPCGASSVGVARRPRATTWWYSASSAPSSASPPATTSNTVRRLGASELLREPRDAERRARARPRRRRARRSPSTIFSSVDLPAPLRPIRQTRSPARSGSSRRRAAARRPKAIETWSKREQRHAQSTRMRPQRGHATIVPAGLLPSSLANAIGSERGSRRTLRSRRARRPVRGSAARRAALWYRFARVESTAASAASRVGRRARDLAVEVGLERGEACAQLGERLRERCVLRVERGEPRVLTSSAFSSSSELRRSLSPPAFACLSLLVARVWQRFELLDLP